MARQTVTVASAERKASAEKADAADAKGTVNRRTREAATADLVSIDVKALHKAHALSVNKVRSANKRRKASAQVTEPAPFLVIGHTSSGAVIRIPLHEVSHYNKRNQVSQVTFTACQNIGGADGRLIRAADKKHVVAGVTVPTAQALDGGKATRYAAVYIIDADLDGPHLVRLVKNGGTVERPRMVQTSDTDYASDKAGCIQSFAVFARVNGDECDTTDIGGSMFTGGRIPDDLSYMVDAAPTPTPRKRTPRATVAPATEAEMTALAATFADRKRTAGRVK